MSLVRLDRGGRVISESRENYGPPTLSPEQLNSRAENSVARHRSEIAVRRKRRNSDSVTQSFVLLATMIVMLLSARFIVPRIVEEVRYAWHRGQLRAEYETAGDGLKNVSLGALSQAYQMVTSVVGPSVVHIDVSRTIDLNLPGFPASLHSEQLRQRALLPSSDQGSGVLVDAGGYILTNNHVISGGDTIWVTLPDGRRRPAAVVGTDSLTDLAVLKIDADRLIPIQWGDSDKCNVGSPVWAIGSPFGLDRTVTFGILSGKHRMVRASTQYQDFMQSDVAVNPGNSGGPLVDAAGSLVGINTAIVGDTYQGVSFSIPSNVAQQVYQRIREVGRVQRAWLGVALSEVPDELLVGENSRLRGALVSGMAGQESPASRAGIQPGDLILSLDGENISDMAHLMRKIGSQISGTTVELGIQRRDHQLNLSVALEARPESLDP